MMEWRDGGREVDETVAREDRPKRNAWASTEAGLRKWKGRSASNGTALKVRCRPNPLL